MSSASRSDSSQLNLQPNNNSANAAAKKLNAIEAVDQVLAPWRSPLAKAIHRNRAQPFSRYFQLATVRPDGTPANRTVVFRGFCTGSNQLMVIGDRRSEKIEQIAKNPAAEACWYFAKTREQFRLCGQLAVVTADTAPASFADARQRLWQQISDTARLQFAWPCPKAPRADSPDFSPPPPDKQTPPPQFCLLLLAVSSVDHLELRGEPQNRHLYTKVDPSSTCLETQQWQVTAVNP